MTAPACLQLRHLHADIGGRMKLTDINLHVAAGEVTAIIGPNGAGKTSLLRAICGELELSDGSVTFNDTEMKAWPVQARAQHLSVLPQRSYLEFPFTVEEVVNMGRIPHNTSQRHNSEIVLAALELVDCSQFLDRFYLELSGGEKQRVQLARVAAQIWEAQDQNRCLVLDEPSASLDLAHQAMIVQMVRHFSQQGVAVLIVLHDLNLASKCADQLLVLQQGKVVASGQPSLVLTEQLIADTFSVEALVRTSEKDGAPVVIT